MRPALLALVHGTYGTNGTQGPRGTCGSQGLQGIRDLDRPEVLSHLLDDVRRRLPGVDVLCASVEVIAPGVREVMPGTGPVANLPRERGAIPPGAQEVMSGRVGPAVVVPLFMSGGYHVATDLSAAAGLSGAPVHLAGPLGPDRYLARVMTARLREAGALFGDAVVLAAAGSEDPAAQAAAEQAAELLRSEWGPRVTLAFVPGAGPEGPAMGPDVPLAGRDLSVAGGELAVAGGELAAAGGESSAAGPDLPAAVELLRKAGAKRVCVAPYVLLPGRFASRVTALASAAGATSVAPVLGRHRLVADLVALRYQEGLSVLAATPHLAAGSLSGTMSDQLSETMSSEGLYSGPAAQLLGSNQ